MMTTTVVILLFACIAVAAFPPPPPRGAAADEKEGSHRLPEFGGKVAVVLPRPLRPRDRQHDQLVRFRVVRRPARRSFEEAILMAQELVPAPPRGRHRAQHAQGAVPASLLKLDAFHEDFDDGDVFLLRGPVEGGLPE